MCNQTFYDKTQKELLYELKVHFFHITDIFMHTGISFSLGMNYWFLAMVLCQHILSVRNITQVSVPIIQKINQKENTVY